MSAISIKIEGLDELVSAVKDAPEIVGSQIAKAIAKSILEVQREAMQRVPVDTGILRSSFRSALSMLKGELFVDADYAVYVHEGTRPHWPPFGAGSALEGWSQRHGIEPFLVARSIAMRGTKAQPFLKEGLEASTDNINKHFKTAYVAALDLIAERANNQIG